jgi:hypothetical protein
MTIFRVKNKAENFTTIDNRFLKNATLSWKAKGLLTFLLSRPNNWKIKLKEVVTHSSDKEHSTYGALRELKAAGYIRYERIRDASGAFMVGSCGYYDVFETPELSGVSAKKDYDLPCGDHHYEEQNPYPDNHDEEDELPFCDFQDEAVEVPHRDFQDEAIEVPHRDFQDEAIEVPHRDFQDEAIEVPHRDFQDEVVEVPHRDFPRVENPRVENQVLLNTKCSKYKNNKTNTNTNAQITSEKKSEEVCLSPPPAAVYFHDGINARIGKTLTLEQETAVHRFVFNDLPAVIAVSSPQTLCQEIITALLNPRNFSQAEDDFLKKFNTIKKCIREKRWRTPAGFAPSTQADVKTPTPSTNVLPIHPEYHEKIKLLMEKCGELEEERESFLAAMQQYAEHPQYVASLHDAVRRCDEKIKILQEKIRQHSPARSERLPDNSITTTHNPIFLNFKERKICLS